MKNNIVQCENDEDKIPVGTAEDLSGQVFGNLIVLYRVKNNGKSRSAKWRCQCQCKNKTIIDVLASNLKKNHTTSCGCIQKQKASIAHLDDLTNKRFGRLIVLERGPQLSNSGRVMWKCQCDCGNIREIDGTSLRTGKTQSCGCLHNELISQKFTIDLTGQRFGYLTVLEKSESDKNGVRWLCQCDCGSTCIVSAGHLRSGDTKSCGCMKRSYGETKIEQLLTDNNFLFVTEKTFSNCCFPDTNKLARFDFYVNNKYLIEFDGQQHFSYQQGDNTWNTQENYEKTKRHDEFKNKWCQENNIPLIRIPYWKIDTLTINDLILKEESDEI